MAAAKVVVEKPWWKERDLWIVLLAAWAARAAFIRLLPAAAYSSDTDSWMRMWQTLSSGGNPYTTPPCLPYPPLWIQIVFVLGKTRAWTGLSFVLLLRLLLIGFESALIVATWELTKRTAPHARRLPLFLAGMSLNPIAILIVCQHGQFDVLVALWIVLMLLSLVRFNESRDALDWLLACVFLGLAILTKTVPLILAPLAFLGTGGLSRKARVLGWLFILGPVTLGLSVIYVLAPDAVAANVIGFRSLPGWFGITGILLILGEPAAARAYQSLYPLAALGTVIVLSIAAYRGWKLANAGIALIALTLLVSVPLLGTGYGPQYIFWSIPPAVACALGFGPFWKWLTIGCFAVAIVTYVFEYAICPSHGMFLVRMFPESAALVQMSRTWSDQAHQTLARLPWFFALAWFFASAVRILARAPAAAPTAAGPSVRAKK